MVRRKFDQYFTPEHAFDALERRAPRLPGAGDVVVEPCVGGGAIARRLRRRGCVVITGDIDDTLRDSVTGDRPDVIGDARLASTWESFEALAAVRGFNAGTSESIAWVVSNFPFTHAFEILQHAHRLSRVGVIILARLSFLEPTGKVPETPRDRGPWLEQNPPSDLIVTPRISFTGNGRHDNVTTGWLGWNTNGAPGVGVQVVAKDRNRRLPATSPEAGHEVQV